MRTPIALSLFTTLLLVACQSGIDHEKLEAAIKKECDGKEWPVKSVSCPTGKSAKPGDKFECTVTFKDDQKLPVDVSVEDSAGNVKFKTKSKVTPIKKVQKNIAAAVEKKLGHPVEIDCEHHQVLIVKEEEEITCSLNSNNHEDAKIKIIVEDEEGNVKWKIKE